jgi:hypothetical protein
MQEQLSRLNSGTGRAFLPAGAAFRHAKAGRTLTKMGARVNVPWISGIFLAFSVKDS